MTTASEYASYTTAPDWAADHARMLRHLGVAVTERAAARRTLSPQDCSAILRDRGWYGMSTSDALGVLLAHSRGARLASDGDLMLWMWNAGVGVSVAGRRR